MKLQFRSKVWFEQYVLAALTRNTNTYLASSSKWRIESARRRKSKLSNLCTKFYFLLRALSILHLLLNAKYVLVLPQFLHIAQITQRKPVACKQRSGTRKRICKCSSLTGLADFCPLFSILADFCQIVNWKGFIVLSWKKHGPFTLENSKWHKEIMKMDKCQIGK